MMGTFLKSRGMRKLFRNKLAVFAMGIIGLYILIGLSIMAFGTITVEETNERVGANTVPPTFMKQLEEKRYEDADQLLDQVVRANTKVDPEERRQALENIHFGEKVLADHSQEVFRDIAGNARQILKSMNEIEDLNGNPIATERLTEVEALVESLFAPLEGLDKIRYNARVWLGTDRQGRSVFIRACYSIRVAILVGLITALISVTLGALLGAAGGYYGGFVDNVVIWLYSTFSSVPNLVLLTVLAYMFTGTRFDGTLIPVYVAFCSTFWIGPCRVIRGETLKLKELEYVQAATTIGFRRIYILVKHIIPNTSHLMFINFSLLFIGAIKSEVILTFLGLGVKEGASWGLMIRYSGQEVINGHFWQIGTATVFMFGLVMAFNILSDALQDAFDPKHV